MSEYFNLCCKDCEISLNLGKKISRNGKLVMQGMFSEEKKEWVGGDAAWVALQYFLQLHQGHTLIFESDSTFPEMQLYEQQDFDDLMADQ